MTSPEARFYTDQNGHKIPWEKFLGDISESILANLIAFHRAGIPQHDIKLVVGKDGGTVIGGGAVFQTPVTKKLTDAEGKELFNHFKFLLEKFEKKEIDEDRIHEICAKNRVDHKISVIKKSL